VIGIEVRASRDLKVLSAKLKEAGDRGLRREVLGGMRAGAKPLIAAARDAARDELPSHGGLNEWVASATFGVRTLLNANPRVRIVATKKGKHHDLKAIDEGRLRHPTFGRPPWVVQPITPHVVTDAMEREVDAVREVLAGAIDDYLRRLT